MIVLFSDSSFHNGPLATGDGLRAPYMSISPAPAEWPAVLTAMRSSNTTLLFMSSLSGTSPAALAQRTAC